MSKAIIGFVIRKPLGAFGGFIILLMMALAVTAPVIAVDPLEWFFSDRLQGPSATHWLGTDDVGRDIWSRVVNGARISLYVGFLAVGFGSGIGGTLGIVSAFYGGKTDMGIQRVMDAWMSFPTLILALVVMAALGTGLNNVVIAIGIVQIPRANRVVRSQALAVKETEYALSARAIGASDLRIMAIHIMPQCIAPWIIIATAGLGTAIIAEAGLSFLGMGVPPPNPSWGGMLAGRGRQYWEIAPWMAIFPGVAISMAVYGFNLFGDALRDVLDPRLRGT